MIRHWAILAAAALSLGACALYSKPQLTPLEIQAMQTREFEAQKNVVFAGTMSVFQDLGYTIQNADRDTGLITAKSVAQSSHSFWTSDNRVTQTNATAFIERIGKITKVRLNFVESLQSSSDTGQTNRKDTPILDAAVYQNAFERIESAIFIRSGD